MWQCHICGKPFTKESSHKRHISYCRRNQTRPRTRPRSCRSCNAAKVKCNFQAPCLRCTAKRINCIYELPSRAVATAEAGEAAPKDADEQVVIECPQPDGFLQGSNMLNIAISVENETRATDASGAFDPQNTANMGDVFMELLPLHLDESLAHGYDGGYDGSAITAIPFANAGVPCGTLAWPHASIQPRMERAAQAPWSVWTTSVTNHSTHHTLNPIDMFSLPRRECLALLHQSSLVIQHNTHLVMQALKAYPLMMLRRETLPPFIHPHWHRQSTPILPEPLCNCMSVAQMFAFRSEETRPFIWRTVKAENESFLAQRESFSPQDILAALQAQMIYMIMRFVDGASEPVELNQQLVATYQFLCKRFKKVCGMFCEVDRLFPRPSWEDWVFDESRRRTACLFFVICHCVSVDAGFANCDAYDWLRDLPLASPKTLWEAKSREDWESEYSIYTAMHGTGMHTMGTLIEAHKRNDDPVNSRLLDYWNGRADNLGNLLNIIASIA